MNETSLDQALKVAFQAQEMAKELAAENAALKRDLAMVSHTLQLAYDIREALGWNKFTSLSIMPAEVKRRSTKLATMEEWAKSLRLDLLHEASHSPHKPLVPPNPGGSVIEWAAEEIAALRAMLAALANPGGL